MSVVIIGYKSYPNSINFTTKLMSKIVPKRFIETINRDLYNIYLIHGCFCALHDIDK